MSSWKRKRYEALKRRNPVAKKLLEDKAYREKTVISKKNKPPKYRLTVHEALKETEGDF